MLNFHEDFNTVWRTDVEKKNVLQLLGIKSINHNQYIFRFLSGFLSVVIDQFSRSNAKNDSNIQSIATNGTQKNLNGTNYRAIFLF